MTKATKQVKWCKSGGPQHPSHTPCEQTNKKDTSNEHHQPGTGEYPPLDADLRVAHKRRRSACGRWVVTSNTERTFVFTTPLSLKHLHTHIHTHTTHEGGGGVLFSPSTTRGSDPWVRGTNAKTEGEGPNARATSSTSIASLCVGFMSRPPPDEAGGNACSFRISSKTYRAPPPKDIRSCSAVLVRTSWPRVSGDLKL